MRCLGRASNKADLRSENVQRAAISNKSTTVSRDLLGRYLGTYWVVTRVEKSKTRHPKKAFFRRICDDLRARPGVRKEDVWIVLTDADRTDWSFGNGEMQYEPKLQSIAP